MKTLIFAAATVLALSLSVAALAAPPAAPVKNHPFADTVKQAMAEKFTTGTVKTYNASTRMLDLATGGEFRLSQEVQATPTAGQRVTVRWMLQDGVRVADEVKSN